MIIKDILKFYWNADSLEFNYWIEKARNMQDTEIYECVRKRGMDFYKYPGTNMNLLSCSVCDYRRVNEFSGCSMCNYESGNYKYEAYMYMLHKKNKELYSKAIVDSFKNIRGCKSVPEITEVITCYDFLNPYEMPRESKIMLLEENLFSKAPFFQVFECRATSVCEKELKIVKEHMSTVRTNVIFEFGVEVGNEWIRNYWLHKGVTNGSIINAVNLIHQYGFFVSADILIGIPGLTEETSIRLFIETIDFLEKIGVDNFVVLPLNRKKKTLQGILYDELGFEKKLNEIGVCQQEHTGVPWLYSIVKALIRLSEEKPYIINRIYLSQLLSWQNTVENITAYNKKKCLCNNKYIFYLRLFQKERKIEHINKLKQIMQQDNHGCRRNYEELLEIQKKLEIKDNMRLIVEGLSKKIWRDQYLKYVQKFEEELKLMGS